VSFQVGRHAAREVRRQDHTVAGDHRVHQLSVAGRLEVEERSREGGCALEEASALGRLIGPLTALGVGTQGHHDRQR
jgi:hypothetical protein